jgi:carbohydrate diacid regulator
MLDDKKREIVRAFADCNMNVSATAKKLYLHRNTVVYHLEHIHRQTGLNPLNFYDLIKLLEIVEDCL